MKSKKGLILFSVGIVALMVGLIVTYAGKVSLLYLKTDEVFARLSQSAATQHKGPESLVGKYLRIHGTLKPKTTQRIKGRTHYQFYIQGQSGKAMQVFYDGILPDTFRDGAELVIEGKLERPDLFVARTVFAKCPTKYKEEKAGGYKKIKPTPAS